MGSLIRSWLRASVLRKGGSNPVWTVVGVLGILNRLRKTVGGPKSIPLVSGPIRPGEVIEIRHSGAPSKALRKERGKRAALVQEYAALPAGRKGRKMRKKFAGTMVEEFASGSATSTLSALSKLIDSSKAPKQLSRRQRRKADKRSRKAAKTVARNAARSAARNKQRVAKHQPARKQRPAEPRLSRRASRKLARQAARRVVDQVGS